MRRIKRFSKPHNFRLPISLDMKLKKYLSKNKDIVKSEIFQNAVECFLGNKKCYAKRRLK